MSEIVRNKSSLLMCAVLLGASTTFASLAHAASQTKAAPPPPRPAPRVAAPMVRKPGAPGGNNNQANKRTGTTGTSAAGGAAKGAAAEANPRGQLLEMLHPGGGAPAPKLHAGVHPADVHEARDRAAFAKPAHIPHNPNHHVGRIGDRFHHAPFMFARDGHRFYRRYYFYEGRWFWYDEAAAAAAEQSAEDARALPVCEAEADECQGDVVPLPAAPDPNATAGDPGPQQ
jgi:hypothetical protein